MRETKKNASSRGSNGSARTSGAQGRTQASGTRRGGGTGRSPAGAQRQAATRQATPSRAGASAARRSAAAPSARREAAAPDPVTPSAGSFTVALPPRVHEEETIESSKYVARVPRRFEEERFLVPQSYGVNKVRLLIRDPQWLFAHWDVDPRSFDELRQAVGERMLALARLTLRVHDALSGGASVVLLPIGSRSWYVRADATRRSYRAELGVTLPSGEFRLLAESNTVIMPRQSPSSERARQTQRYTVAAAAPPAAAPESAVAAEREALAEAGPWQAPPPQEAVAPPPPAPAAPAAEAARQGGASDAFRR